MPARWRIASHEAGHVVCAVLLGRTVQGVSIVGHGATAGWAADRSNGDGWGLSEALDEALVALAGPAAEQAMAEDEQPPKPQSSGGSSPPSKPTPHESRAVSARLDDPWRVPWSDRDYAHALAGGVTYSDDETNTLLAWLETRARNLVSQPRSRLMVRHIAEALLRDGALDQTTTRIELQRAELRAEREGIVDGLITN